MKKKLDTKRLILLNFPYVFAFYFVDKIAALFRQAPGTELIDKLTGGFANFGTAFANPLPSFHPFDLLIGVAAGALLKLAVYVKGKNRKKFRQGEEYGSARWGKPADIRPYTNGVFKQFHSQFSAHLNTSELRNAISVVSAVAESNGRIEIAFGEHEVTASYGYTTSLTDVNNWLNGYLYTYVITSSNARFYGCNWLTAKGTPNEWAKEPNSGGYYYQFGFACTDNKATKKVLLSQSRLKPSQNGNQPFNAYVFFSIQNSSISLDAGIYSGKGDGNWRICIYGGGKFDDDAIVCGSTQNSAGEYVADADIQLTVISFVFTITSISLYVNINQPSPLSTSSPVKYS